MTRSGGRFTLVGVAVAGLLVFASSTASSMAATAVASTGSTQAAFVSATFHDLLDRPPSSSSSSTWSTKLGSGTTTREAYLRYLTGSPATTAEVAQLYLTILGRVPSAAAVANWVGLIGRDKATLASVAETFYASTEYAVRIGAADESELIASLYPRILHRAGSASAIAHWLAVDLTYGRLEVTRGLYGSLEARRDQVTAIYRRLLHRAPGATQLTAWSAALASGDPSGLQRYLAGSGEYFSLAAARTYPTTPVALPDGLATSRYSASLSATGGLGPYSWVAFALPHGLTQAASAISGVPLAVGTFLVTVDVQDAWGSVTTATVPLRISRGAGQTIASGMSHTCALATGGTVKCWGKNDHGQLGDGTFDPSSTAVSVIGVSGAVALSAGGDRTCALLGSGSITCWGYGPLGDDSPDSYQNRAVMVSGISTAIKVTVGGSDICAILTGGTVSCWGADNTGQLGDTLFAGRLLPVAIPNIRDVVTLTMAGPSVCIILLDGTEQCWGTETYGTSTPPGYTGSPIGLSVIGGITNARAISSQGWVTCTLIADGTVSCWSLVSQTWFGGDTTVPAATTVTLPGVTGAVELPPTGYNHACVLITGGTTMCWGGNDQGQLGTGVASDTPTPAPVAATTVPAISELSSGMDFSCARITGAGIECWGYNYDHQLGNGGTNQALTPVSVTGL